MARANAAYAAYVAQPPDLVLCDIGLPGEDGYGLIRLIREHEQSQGAAHVPAVAVTAFASRQDRERALAAGFDEHVTKPVDPTQLVSLLERLVAPSQGA